MPNTMRLPRSEGVEFTLYITPYPICAPSRASLLSGNYAHNHRVFRISGENGGGAPFTETPSFGRTSPCGFSGRATGRSTSASS